MCKLTETLTGIEYIFKSLYIGQLHVFNSVINRDLDELYTVSRFRYKILSTLMAIKSRVFT